MLLNQWPVKDFYLIEYIPRGIRLTAYGGDAADLPATVLQEFLDAVADGSATARCSRRPAHDVPCDVSHDSGSGYNCTMARYTVSVRTPKPADEAFAYMADLRNFAEWDPGVKAVKQIHGDGADSEAIYDVTVYGFARDLTLRYRTTTFEPSSTVAARAESRMLTSLDTITATPTDEGSIVTYDAELTFNGPLKLADSLLGLAFGRIGDRAANGLIRALDGTRVDGNGT